MRKRRNAVPNEKPTMEETELFVFAKKAMVFSVIFSVVFAITLSLSLNQVLPDVHSVERLLLKTAEHVNFELENDRNRLRLFGFLSRNPYVHHRISVLEENAGRLDRAIEEIELALGLFELSSVANPERGKYLQRLSDLKVKHAAHSRTTNKTRDMPLK